MGLQWSFDWTVRLDQYEDPSVAISPEEAVADITAARSTDLFILLLTEEWSRGAHVEMGARIGADKKAHVILRGHPSYFFYHDMRIIQHEDETAFLKWVERHHSPMFSIHCHPPTVAENG
jgi:hypothetical protein